MPNIIKEPRVLQKTGWSHSTLWKKVGEGLFPAPVKLDPTGRAVGWIEGEIDDLIAEAIRRRDAERAVA